MTEQERAQKFLEGMRKLEAQFGITVRAELKTEQLGAVLQTRAELIVVTIADWEPPKDDTG